MNDKEKELLNRWCHTVLLGKCKHRFDPDELNRTALLPRCLDCGARPLSCQTGKGEDRYKVLSVEWRIPDYTSSLDLASIVEAKAIELKGWNIYSGALLIVVGYSRNEFISKKMVTASAPTRCKAARAAVEGDA